MLSEQPKHTNIPKHLAYVSGQLFDDYIHDMKIVQRYAELNRKARRNDINIIEFFSVDNKQHWLDEIRKSDWRATSFLAYMITEKKF